MSLDRDLNIMYVKQKVIPNTRSRFRLIFVTWHRILWVTDSLLEKKQYIIAIFLDIEITECDTTVSYINLKKKFYHYCTFKFFNHILLNDNFPSVIAQAYCPYPLYINAISSTRGNTCSATIRYFLCWSTHLPSILLWLDMANKKAIHSIHKNSLPVCEYL